MELSLDDTQIMHVDDEILENLDDAMTKAQKRLFNRRRLEQLQEEKTLRHHLKEVWSDDFTQEEPY